MMILVVPPVLPRSFAAFFEKNFQMPHEIPYFGRGRKRRRKKCFKKTKTEFLKTPIKFHEKSKKRLLLLFPRKIILL